MPPARSLVPRRIRRKLVWIDIGDIDAALGMRLGSVGHWLWIGGPLPRRADGITLGRLVIVRRRASATAPSSRLLRHEQVHVAQFRERGTARFLLRYVTAYIALRLQGWNGHGAYRRIPDEIEARAVSSETHATRPISLQGFRSA